MTADYIEHERARAARILAALDSLEHAMTKSTLKIRRSNRQAEEAHKARLDRR